MQAGAEIDDNATANDICGTSKPFPFIGTELMVDHAVIKNVPQNGPHDFLSDSLNSKPAIIINPSLQKSTPLWAKLRILWPNHIWTLHLSYLNIKPQTKFKPLCRYNNIQSNSRNIRTNQNAEGKHSDLIKTSKSSLFAPSQRLYHSPGCQKQARKLHSPESQVSFRQRSHHPLHIVWHIFVMILFIS